MKKAADPYQSLRIPQYRWFLAALGLMTLGIQVQGLTVGWQICHRTGNPLALGLVGLAEALPFLGTALFGGLAADRLNRKRLNALSTGCLFLCALLLAWVTWRWNQDPADQSLWQVYAIIAVTGVARAFGRPANTALGADLIPREHFANAATWRSSLFHIGMVAGPPLGGLLYAWKGPLLAHGCSALLLGLSALSLLPIAYTPRPRPPRREGLRESLAQGLRFVKKERLLLGTMSLDLFAVLFGGAVAMLPFFAQGLGVGPAGLGVMRAAPGLGSILMGAWMAHRPPLKRAGRTMLGAVAVFGLTWIAFPFVHVFALALALLFLGGAMDNISVVLRSTLLQTQTPEEMLGRVASVNQIFIASSNEIGSFESGLAARLMGLVPSVVFGGCMTLLTVGMVAWRVPELRRLKRVQGQAG